MSTEAEIVALARRAVDGVDQGDIETQYACYAPDAKIWHNIDEREQTLEENVGALREFIKRISNREHTNSRIQVFDGGFVHQFVLHGVRADGVKLHLPVCLVCQVKDGKIIRRDEYIDSAGLAAFR